ncbi:major facilitator superfamily domain-containing protein [Leptodontidium sp. 2 PMI_412]|nr:major facilitator superfamily domain-containing protein [Leptodontidium sp. 2 PMI_412]
MATLRQASPDCQLGDEINTPVYKVYKRRYIGLLQLCLLNLVVAWNWINFAPVAGITAEHFNTTIAVINWFSTSFLFACVCSNVFASLALRKGPKFSMMVSASLMIVGVWLKYAGTKIHSLGLAMLGQLLLGFAQPFVLNAPVFYSETWFTVSTRTTATAIASIPSPFGGVMGSLVSPAWIFVPGDVAKTSLWLGIITTAICVLTPFVPKSPPTPPAPQNPEHERQQFLPGLVNLFKSTEFYLILFPFAIIAGLFNAISTVMWMILTPYGFDNSSVGLSGALFIVVGLGVSLILSPIADKWKIHLIMMKIAAVLTGFSFLAMIWVPPAKSKSFLYGICSLASIAILGVTPVALEFITEVLYPLRVELAISIMWLGGQLLGGILIISMSYMSDSNGTYQPALYLTAACALAVAPLTLSLGLFGRREYVVMQRSKEQAEARTAPFDA